METFIVPGGNVIKYFTYMEAGTDEQPNGPTVC